MSGSRKDDLIKQNSETLSSIKKKFPALEIKEGNGYACELSIEIPRESILDVCRYLHDDNEMNYDYIVDICSVDFPNDKMRFVVIYHFFSIPRRHRIRVKTRVGIDELSVESVTSIWKGAEFMEDEVYDMMGICFENHPDLRRIMMTDDFEGYPLRKDFPVKGKGWRHDFDFIPTMEEV